MLDIDRIICEPKLKKWSGMVRSNRSLSKKSFLLTNKEISQLKRSIISQSISYTSSIDPSFNIDSLSISTYDSDCEIVMTGHQPIICHSGILVKNRLLDCYAAENSAFVINIIIDTDYGNGGQFCYPSKKSGKISLEKVSVSDVDSVYFNQNIINPEQVKQAFNRVRDGGLVSDSEFFTEVEDYYVSRAGCNVVEVNSVLKRRFCNLHRTLELPLTELIKLLEIKTIFANIIKDYQRFYSIYNSELKEYRKKKKIRSKVNPFPDLNSDDNGFELPFWIISKESGNRYPLFVREDGASLILNYDVDFIRIHKDDISCYAEHLPENLMIVPRAVLITLILRLFCSDLFIHGLGGAKYDQFTDALISSYLSIKPPKYVTASADVYMFKKQIEKYESFQAESSKKREIVYQLEEHLQGDMFTDEEKELLGKLLTEKKQYVQSLVSCSDKSKKKDIAIRLKEIDLNIKKNIDTSSYFLELSSYVDKFSESREAYYCRKYPFFLVDTQFDFLFKNNR